MPETQARRSLPGILEKIVSTKRQELEELRPRAAALEAASSSAPPPRPFAAALARNDTVSLIAECKRRSPGAGEIRPGLDPVSLARSYELAGAAAMSVLTDRHYFGGSLDDLRAAREAVSLPVLRKDFTLDPLHLLEARAGGADAVLLIVRILDDAELTRLHQEARGLGMDVLVEVHDEEELERALRAGAEIVGINNRDLSTFETDLDTTLRLVDGLPPGVVTVSESGIRNAADVGRLGSVGVAAILVGEALLVADDPGVAAHALVGISSTPRR